MSHAAGKQKSHHIAAFLITGHFAVDISHGGRVLIVFGLNVQHCRTAIQVKDAVGSILIQNLHMQKTGIVVVLLDANLFDFFVNVNCSWNIILHFNSSPHVDFHIPLAFIYGMVFFHVPLTLTYGTACFH